MEWGVAIDCMLLVLTPVALCVNRGGVYNYCASSLKHSIKVSRAHTAPHCSCSLCRLSCSSLEDEAPQWRSLPEAPAFTRQHPASADWPPGKQPSKGFRHPVSTGGLAATAPAYPAAPAMGKASGATSSWILVTMMCCSLAMRNQQCKT